MAFNSEEFDSSTMTSNFPFACAGDFNFDFDSATFGAAAPNVAESGHAVNSPPGDVDSWFGDGNQFAGELLHHSEFLDDYMTSRGYPAPSLSPDHFKTSEELIELALAEAAYVDYYLQITGEPQNQFAAQNNSAPFDHQQVVPNRDYSSLAVNTANHPSSSPQQNSYATMNETNTSSSFTPPQNSYATMTGIQISSNPESSTSQQNSHANMNEIQTSSKAAKSPAPKARSRAQSKANSSTSSSQDSAKNNSATSTATAKTPARNRKTRVQSAAQQPVAQDGPLLPIRDDDGQLQMVRPDIFYHEAVVKTYLPPLSPILQPVSMATIAAMVDNSGVTAKTMARNPKFRVSRPVSAQQPTMMQQASSSSPHLTTTQQNQSPTQQHSAYQSPYGAQSVDVQQQNSSPQVGPSQQFGFNQQQPGMNNHPNFNHQPGFNQHAGMNQQSRPAKIFNSHLAIGIDYSDGSPADQFDEVDQFHSQFQSNSQDQPIVLDDEDEQDNLFVAQSSPGNNVHAQQSNSFMHRRQGSGSMVQVEEVNRPQASASPNKSLKRSLPFENDDEYEEFQLFMEFKKMKKARASGSGF